ncbi:MAG: hypothetical protein MUD12_09390 [Spirochaetes bacterium]|jgi:tetratricopeptide (TPR) repeat protein|nr:hypothetical protein [Spirochaetota bacterium]
MSDRSPAYILILILLFSAPSFGLENSTDLYKKGARLALNGKIDEAILVFKKVIDISPYYCMGHYGLGKAYLYKYGMIDEAIRQLRLSVKYDTRFAKGYFYLGMGYLLSGKYVDAIHSFRTAYRYNEAMSEALYNTGAVYDLMDRSYKAQVYFGKFGAESKSKEEEMESDEI